MAQIHVGRVLSRALDAFNNNFGKLLILVWKPLLLLIVVNFCLGFIGGLFGIQWLIPIGG